MPSDKPILPVGAISFVGLLILCAAAGFLAALGGRYAWNAYVRPVAKATDQPIRRPVVSPPTALSFAPLPELPLAEAEVKAPVSRQRYRRRSWHAVDRERQARELAAEYAADAAITKRLNEAAKARYDARDQR